MCTNMFQLPVKQQLSSGEPPSIQPISYKTYLCPGCALHYDTSRKNGFLVGRTPYILTCKHTMCEECLAKLLFHNNKIVCFICQTVARIAASTHDGKLHNRFPLNYYLMGLIFCSKNMNYMDSISLSVPTFTKKQPKNSVVVNIDAVQDTCCIVSCKKAAVIKCIDCSDVYCSECSENVHKSVPFMGFHKTRTISGTESTFNLEKCLKHNMDIEFFCKVCEIESCCYCFLEKHEGHDRALLSTLSEAETLEFNVSKNKISKILKQLMLTQKKLRQLYNVNTSKVEIKIGQYFADLHARLYLIEKKLRNDVITHSSDSQDLEPFSTEINQKISLLKDFTVTLENIHSKRYNLKSLLAKMKEYENIPCYLVNKSAEMDTDGFHVNPILDNLEDYFSVNLSPDSKYTLLSAIELPEGYKVDLPDSCESDSEDHTSKSLQDHSDSTVESEAKFSQVSPSSIGTQQTEISSLQKHCLDSHCESDLKSGEMSLCPSETQLSKIYDEVIVTHIDTVDKFYVQRKSLQKKFHRLKKDIDNYKKYASPFCDPQCDDLCLVEYVTRTVREWCRGRVAGFVKSRFCEVFLIDYGNTINVPKDRLFTLKASLRQQKPFAVECKLHNPSNAEWTPDAYLHLAQNIQNKRTFMPTKKFSKGINEIKLMISSQLGTMISVAELLINTCENALSEGDDFSLSSSKNISTTVSRVKLYKNSKRFQVKDSVTVIVTSMKDPQNIYVQLESYREDYQKMMKQIQSCFKSLPRCTPVKENFVIVHHQLPSQGDYHRAQILDVDCSNEMTHICLVDLGCETHIPWSNVRSLPGSLTKLECQAIHMMLAHIEPCGDEWSVDAFQDIQKYILSETPLKVVIQNTTPIEVALFEEGPYADICINAVLVQKDLAKSTGVITVEWKHVQKSKEDDVGFMFLKQTTIVNFDTEDSKSEEIIGIKHPVDVVLVESPDLIYVKFHMNKEKEQQLYTELQVHYTNEKENKYTWKINERCVIHDWKDNEYCRGTVIGVEGAKYKVYLIDKAEERIVCKEQLFILADYFNQYHDMVFKCHLGDIQPAGDKKVWSHMAVEYLQHIFSNNKNLFIKKIGPVDGPSMPVEMWYSTIVAGTALEPSHIQYYSINKILLNKGIALRRGWIMDTKHGNKTASTKKEKSLDQMSSESSATVKVIAQESGLTAVPDVTGSSCSPYENDTRTDVSKFFHAKEETTNWLPALKPTKEKFEAMITCADYDGILHLHDVELEPAYKTMESNLKQFFDSFCTETTTKSDWASGDLCTIHYENKWYRGVISEIKSFNTINVIMIDFGSDHDVSPTDIIPTVAYTDVPAFALKVQLNRVFPKDGVWSFVDYKCLLDNTPEKAKVIIQNGLQSELPLVDVYSTDGICLNDVLVTQSQNLTRLQKLESHCKSGSEHISHELKSELIAPAETKALLSDSEVLKPISFQLVTIPKPDSLGMLKVNVLNIIRVDEIIIDVLGESMKYEELFETITNDIQECWSSQPPLKQIEVGVPCISPFSEDCQWYRARIFNVDELEMGTVLVFFVDYGNIDRVRYSDLRIMKPEWCALPIRNQFAHIPIKLNDQDSRDRVMNCMLQMQGKLTPIEVVSENPLTIHLYNEDKSQYHYQDLLNEKIISLT